jgi:hypothetical protein
LPGPVQSAAGGLLVLGVGLAGIAAVGGKIIGIGIATAEAWTQAATAFGATAVASEAAAGGMTAAGSAAEVADARARPLLGTLGTLAKFAATGIVIAVVATIAINAVESAKSGKASFIEKWANDAVGGIADAIRAVGGTQIADALDDSVAAAQANMSARDITLGLGLKLDQTKGTVDQAIEAGVHGTIVGRLVPDNWIPQVQHADDVIEGLGVTVADVQKQADAAGVSFADMLVQIADKAGVTTPQIDAYKKAQQEANQTNKEGTKIASDNATAIGDQTTSLQDQADAAIKAKKDQDDLNRTIQETLNQQFLAGSAADGLYLPFTRNAEDAVKATNEFNETLDGIVTSALNAERGIEDIAPSLAGMQQGFGKVGDSIIDVMRKMDDVGAINLSPAVRGALDAVSALDKVEVKIADVEKAIQQNQGDMSMWQGRIDLVTNAFGANSQQIGDWLSQLENGTITQDQFNGAINWLAQNGGFPRLDALLAQNKITRQEYNKAVEAGTWLLQRSSGALQDEDAQIVGNIIDLAKYAQAHDDADAKVKKLSESQRGFLAAMGDAKTQTFLQTLQLLTYLAVVGQIPKEQVTKFIADSAQADPVIKGVAEDLGLIPNEKHHTVVVDAETEKAKKKIKDLNTIKVDGKTVHIDLETIDAVGKLKDIEGTIHSVTASGKTIEVFADTTDAANKFLDLNQNEIAKLDGKELKVYVKGDDGQWVTVKDHIIKETIPDKTVTVVPTLNTTVIATGAGIPLSGGNLLGNLGGISIPVTADDQTKTGTDSAKANLDQFATDAGTAGTNAGTNFSTGLTTGFQNGVNIAVTAANGIIGALSSVVNGVYNYGFNGGYNFGIGVANGIAATWNAVFNAAFNVGYAAYLGNQAGMQAHSPSKLGLKGGANWGQSVAMGIASTASDVLNAGKALGASLAGVISAPDLSPSLRAAALSADSRPRGDLLAGDRGGNVSHRSVVFNVTNQFHGITDTGEIIDRVNTQTYQALTRAQAAGAFGS